MQVPHPVLVFGDLLLGLTIPFKLWHDVDSLDDMIWVLSGSIWALCTLLGSVPVHSARSMLSDHGQVNISHMTESWREVDVHASALDP